MKMNANENDSDVPGHHSKELVDVNLVVEFKGSPACARMRGLNRKEK